LLSPPDARAHGTARARRAARANEVRRTAQQLDKHIGTLEARVETALTPFRKQRDLLTTIPGIDEINAAAIIAETGVDMAVFKSAAHLAAWAGVCPGNNESAGKKKRSDTRKGNVHLMTVLVEAAHSASQKKDSYLKDKFFRLKARRGSGRAAMAIAHKLLKTVYIMLSSGTEYRDLGAAYLDSLDARRVKTNLVRRLERLGYDVMITPKQPQPPEPTRDDRLFS
jgi:transposase